MNPPNCNEMDYINFLIAAQQVFSSVEASQTHPAEEQAPVHDAYTRLLKRLPPDSQALWQEVQGLVNAIKGVFQLKSNREVSLDRSGNRAISEIFIPSQGCLVHLKGYGWVKVFRTVGTNDDADYWATSRLDMAIEQVAFHALDAWQIEVYHWGLKQFTGVERGQYRLEVSQRNHIGLAIRTFVRLEVHRLRTGISWFDAKTGIIRSAMRLCLAQPSITLGSTA